MHSEWQQFLSGLGARTEADSISDFTDPENERRAALAGDCLADLSHTALITLTGKDSREYLQSQLSCDLDEVTATTTRLGTWCNPKGRVLLSFRVIEAGDQFYLFLPNQELGEHLGKLRLYILRSDVVMGDASDEVIRIGISGQRVAARLAEIAGALPTAIDGAIQFDALHIIRVAGPAPRFEIMGDNQALQTLWQQLQDTATAVGRPAWDLLDILAAVPTINAKTAGQFVPQMLNLQALGAISFSKGCYPGQEIVARTKYLGKLKKRLYLATTDAEPAPQPGDRVFADNCDTANNAGAVVNVAAHPDGGHALLAVARIDCAEQGNLRLVSTSGPTLQQLDLPYSLAPE